MTDRVQMRVVVQARDQLTPDDQTKFFSISATPRFLYVVAPWIDALSEINFTRKDQSNGVDTITVSPRIGVQLHILSRLLYGGGGGGIAPRGFGRIMTLDSDTVSDGSGTRAEGGVPGRDTPGRAIFAPGAFGT